MGIKYTLNQVKSIIGGKIIGNGDTIITDVASVETAKEGSITFIKDDSLIPQAMMSMASAIVVRREIQALKSPQIVIENPFLAFTRFTEVVAEERYKRPAGIHPAAIVSKEAIIGKGVSVGAHDVIIGDNTMLIAYAKIAGSTKIGKNVMIAEDVGITDHARIGDNCIIGGGSNVYKSLEPGSVVWGSPAKPINEEKRIQVIIKKLPEMYNAIKKFIKTQR